MLYLNVVMFRNKTYVPKNKVLFYINIVSKRSLYFGAEQQHQNFLRLLPHSG